MHPGALVLVTGPTDPTDWWAGAATELSEAGLPVHTPRDHSRAPLFGVSWIASVAQQLNTSELDGPLVIAGHGTAGPLLPALARAQRAGGRQVAGYVFVDATLPRPGTASHLELLRAAAPHAADEAHERLHDGERIWPVPAEPPGTRPRDHQFWTETLPPAIDWPDAPCTYVSTGHPAPGCGDITFWARSARARGWPVVDDADIPAAVHRALRHLPA
ncbi:hypothetical protein [Phytoactinopolyspora limicola]|uniref:hypothetical protein n=1 Tax=Phytoactinopolyspora limicola TaxID=2715536 RepID=UPI001408C0A2|nr:hypothetical protein [Phytoactinopolyspora limicola]